MLGGGRYRPRPCMKPLVTPALSIVATAIAALCIASATTTARAQDASGAEELELTIGADGTADVREVRSAQFSAGDCRLRVFDVSPQLLPESVTLRALTGPDLVELREQRAWFEVLDTARALERLAGRPARLIRHHEDGTESLDGRLLFPPVVPGPKGELKLPLYLEQSDGKIRLLEDAEIELDTLPAGDWNRLRLDWRVACRRADRYRLELLYRTRGLAWHADATLRVAPDGQSGDFTASATIDNQTGVAWRNTRLALAEASVPLAAERRPDAERATDLVHAVADGATLEARVATQFVLLQLRDTRLESATCVLIDRAPDRNGTLARGPVVRRFALADPAARALLRQLPIATARTILLDTRNRPWSAPSHSWSPTGLASFLADPVPGLFATQRVERELKGDATRTRVTVTLRNERDEAAAIELLCPLEPGEKIDGADATRLSPGIGRVVVGVAPRASASSSFAIVPE